MNIENFKALLKLLDDQTVAHYRDVASAELNGRRRKQSSFSKQLWAEDMLKRFNEAHTLKMEKAMLELYEKETDRKWLRKLMK